jgi:2,4-dienoyl-CoA reductase-like NADH-dependent reductase (Old Yellow Enzyme family)
MIQYPKSFSEIQINKSTLKNRICASPISLNMATTTGQITGEILSYFENLADGDLGLIIVGNACVSNIGKGAKNEIVIGQNDKFDGIKKLSEIIKYNGSKSCIQIAHCGAQGNTKYSGEIVVGPSEYTVPTIGIKSKSLNINEIKSIEEEYISAIIQADKAGFDFIEIMMAHGYLIHQFLSEHTNKREDDYGGSEENRLRFIKNIFEKINNYVDLKKIAVRITGDDYLENGLNINKLKFLINYLNKKEISYYAVTAGIYETAPQKYTHMKKGCYWDYAKQLKEHTKIPIMAQGNITTISEGEEILKKKQADFWGMGQALIADPKLVKKTINKNEDEVYMCLAHIKVGSCHRCRYLKQKDKDFACVTPGSWSPNLNNKINANKRKKDINFWKKIINNL